MKTKYIGFDQSSKVVGYAVMDGNSLISYGQYIVPNTSCLMERVDSIIGFVDELVNAHGKDDLIIGFEDTQESRMNTNTFQLLTKVLGILEFWAYCNNIEYKVLHVSSWRKHAGIKGKRREEKKANAIKKVQEKFGNAGEFQVSEDAAEAILITDYLRSL